jgi:hypothetical protein
MATPADVGGALHENRTISLGIGAFPGFHVL